MTRRRLVAALLGLAAIVVVGLNLLQSSTPPSSPKPGDAPRLQSIYTVSVDPTTAWQPRGATIRIPIESTKTDVVGKTVDVSFGWTKTSGEVDWTNAGNVRLAKVDNPRKVVVEVEVPDLKPSPGRRLFGIRLGDGTGQLLGLVPDASVRISLTGKDDTENAQEIRHVGITSVLHGLIAAAVSIASLLWYLRLATSSTMKGKTVWLRLIETPEHKASLSQLQIMVWVLVLGGGAAYVMALSGNLIPITQTALGLLGISGVATLGSQLTSKPQTVASDEPRWSDLVFWNGQIDVTRVQMLFFTLVVALFVVINIIDHYAIPEVPQSYLGLLGISNGVYLLNRVVQDGRIKSVVVTAPGSGWDPLESTCRHASLSIL